MRASSLAAASALYADVVAREVGSAFASAGVSSILLRGPSIARHLYGGAEVRPYADADLLVPESSRAHAEAALRGLGFTHTVVLGQRSDDRPPWSSTWIGTKGGNVDLHWTVAGARAEPLEVWEIFRAQVETVEVLDVRLDGLNAPATAVVVALHAAHHGAHFDPPLTDLARGLERFRDPVWESASALAVRLDAVDAYAAGLRLLPAGVALAEQLGLPDAPSTETILRAGTAPPMALGFDWLVQTPGIRARTRLVVGKTFPDAEFMRAWSPLARGGSRAGLAAAYVWRPCWLAWHSGPGFLAWLAARRKRREHPEGGG